MARGDLDCGVAASSATASTRRATAGVRSVTLRVIEKDRAFNFVDNPPRQGLEAAPLMGDQFAFTSELLTRSLAHAAVLEATCVVTQGGTAGRGTC